MPPKKISAPTREDTQNSDGMPREGRIKRNQAPREVTDDSQMQGSSTAQPFYIENLDIQSLRRYRSVMHLQSAIPQTSPHDRPSEAPGRYLRLEKAEDLTNTVKRHWYSTQCKETEVITSFMYSVKNQDKTFRMRFTDPPRN